MAEEEEEELEWDEGITPIEATTQEEDSGLEQDELFEILLLQQIQANKAAAAFEEDEEAPSNISRENLNQVVKRVRNNKEDFEARKLERENAKLAREANWKCMQISIVSKIALCIECNKACDEVGIDFPNETIHLGENAVVHNMQKFIGKFRSTFRQSATTALSYNEEIQCLNARVLKDKQGTEMQLCQLLVRAGRRFNIPSRLVFRFSTQPQFNDKRDVWVEFYLGNEWYRAFGSVARVVEEEDEFKRQKVSVPFGKLDANPLYLKSSNTTQLVLAAGECNQLAVVTRRYVAQPKKQIDDFVRQVVVSQWNTDDDGLYSKQALALELERMESLQSKQIPTTRAEFAKANSDFVLPSELGQFRFIKPESKPVDYFKGEPVFRRIDQVGELLTEFMWRKRGRQITDEVPTKVIGGEGTTKAKPMRLFTLEQTEEIDFGEVDLESGTIPTNEFGNVEAWGLPRGSVHLSIAHAEEACKALDVKFARCVVGFERYNNNAAGNNGGNKPNVKPKFDGICIAAQNELIVCAQAEHIRDQRAKELVAEQREANLREWRRLLEANWTLATSNLGRLMQDDQEE